MNSRVMGFLAAIGVNLAESSISPMFNILDFIGWDGDYDRVSRIEVRIANAENRFRLTYSQNDVAYYEGRKAGNYVIAGIGIYMGAKGLAGIAGGNIALSAVGGILGGNGNSGFVRPESAVTGSKKHGVNWKESSASTPYLKFLCKFPRIFFRECRFKNGSVAGYAEYFGPVLSGK